MIEFQSQLMFALLALGALYIIAAVADRFMRRSKRRTQQLSTAAQALESHYDALEQVLDDPAPKLELKEMLVAFSDAISDRRIAHEIAQFLCDEQRVRRGKSDKSKAIAAALRDLRASRPDLVEQFGAALNSGIIALLLRWPETAKEFESLIARLSAHPDQNVTIAAAAAGSRSRRDDDLNGLSGRHAIA